MKKLLHILLFVSMTLLTFWCAGLLWFSAEAITTEQSTTKIPRADAIIVLTGDKGRIEEGFYLFTTKRAPRLFISGVHKDVTVDMLKERWEGTPLPDCCIDLGYAATNTWGNATESAEWIQQNNIGSVFLVTSDYHMPRARLEFSFTVPKVKVYPHPFHAEKDTRSTFQFIKLLVNEYHKTVLTYLRNKLTPTP